MISKLYIMCAKATIIFECAKVLMKRLRKGYFSPALYIAIKYTILIRNYYIEIFLFTLQIKLLSK